MASRKRYLSSQLGKDIPEPGAHMAPSAVGILLRKRRRKTDDIYVKAGSKVKPIVSENPFPEASDVNEVRVVREN